MNNNVEYRKRNIIYLVLSAQWEMGHGKLTIIYK